MAIATPITDPGIDAGEPPKQPPRPARMPAGRAILVALLTLLIGALLSSDELVRVAERQPLGSRRDLALRFANPIDRVSDFLGLDRLRRGLASWTGHEPPATEPVVPLPVPSTVPSTQTTTASTQPPSTTTTVAPRRIPTPENPVKVLIVGDSLMYGIATEFTRAVRDEPRVAVTSEVQVSTGLARPDYFNWPVELTNLIAAQNPDVVVMMFGTNDAQGMLLADGHGVSFGSDGWRAEYQRRVAQMMDIATAGGRDAVWIGLPQVTRGDLNAAKDVINALVDLEASVRPDVHVVQTVPLLGGPDGGYTDYLPDANGVPVRVREPDGIHLTPQGCDRIVPVVYDQFKVEYRLDTPWPPPPAPAVTPSPRTPAGGMELR